MSAAIPESVLESLATLWRAGHAAYVVGGALRDVVAGRTGHDWDLATSALPEETVGLFDHAVYENRFGTVAVRVGREDHQVTTFRRDHDYADFRRPHRVEFGTSIEADLARRDFTVNALAWGASPDADGTIPPPTLIDPFDGIPDIAAGVIRAVGDPRRRFEEDALRIVRAIRFATTLGWEIAPATLAAIRVTAPLVSHLSGERIAMELDRLLAADRPSAGLRLLADTGVLATISAELAAQRGIGQNKTPGEDLWDHTVRTVDAARATRPGGDDLTIVRWSALLHDIGKPATAADGHFYHHDAVGADLAAALLDGLHLATATRQRIVHLVRHHMFRYERSWGDPAVRRFLARIGPDAIDQLFALRVADNVGSGVAPEADDLDDLRRRVMTELAAGPILDRSALAIDGSDLMRELGVAEGPDLGRILGWLFERVVENPALNERGRLVGLARDWLVRHTPGEDRHAEARPTEVAAPATVRPSRSATPPFADPHAGPVNAVPAVADLAGPSVQLYTVRAALAEDVDATLGRLARIGFRRVEPFDLLAYRHGLASSLARHGLSAPTAHVSLLGDAQLDEILDAAAELGIGTLIQPWTDPGRWHSPDGLGRIADELNGVAVRAAERGIRIGYHNHHFELESAIDGRHALEVFADRLAPGVVLEVDTYWAFAGGADVPALLRRLGDRVAALHVKDGDGGLDPATQVAAGAGVLPIPDILAAAPRALRVVELDATAGDLFEAVMASRAYLLALEPEPPA